MIGLSLVGEPRADVHELRLLSESMLRRGLRKQTLTSNLRILLQVQLRIHSMPPLIPIDEPDHVDGLLSEVLLEMIVEGLVPLLPHLILDAQLVHTVNLCWAAFIQ